jgi:hypothetical protein
MKQTVCNTVPSTLVVIMLITKPVHAASQYSIIDLGTLGGAESWVSAINN